MLFSKGLSWIIQNKLKFSDLYQKHEARIYDIHVCIEPVLDNFYIYRMIKTDSGKM